MSTNKFKTESFFKYLRGRERHDPQALIKLIERAFTECKKVHPGLHKDIYQAFLIMVGSNPTVEEVKSNMYTFFEEPDTFEVGQECSDIFMKAAKSLPHDEL